MRQRRIPEIEQETLSASFILKVAHSILVLQVCSFALFVAHKFHINFLEETEGEKVEKSESRDFLLPRRPCPPTALDAHITKISSQSCHTFPILLKGRNFLLRRRKL